MKERGAGLVGCLGFNCPLRQYFSLYWAGKQESRASTNFQILEV